MAEEPIFPIGELAFDCSDCGKHVLSYGYTTKPRRCAACSPPSAALVAIHRAAKRSEREGLKAEGERLNAEGKARRAAEADALREAKREAKRIKAEARGAWLLTWRAERERHAVAAKAKPAVAAKAKRAAETEARLAAKAKAKRAAQRRRQRLAAKAKKAKLEAKRANREATRARLAAAAETRRETKRVELETHRAKLAAEAEAMKEAKRVERAAYMLMFQPAEQEKFRVYQGTAPPPKPLHNDDRVLRDLTAAEVEELAELRRLMLRNAYMTEAQRGRWFELSQRHDHAAD